MIPSRTVQLCGGGQELFSQTRGGPQVQLKVQFWRSLLSEAWKKEHNLNKSIKEGKIYLKKIP